jgi:hypothetical protein
MISRTTIDVVRAFASGSRIGLDAHERSGGGRNGCGRGGGVGRSGNEADPYTRSTKKTNDV